MAAQIGQMQGNLHLQGVVASLKQLDRTSQPQAPAASPTRITDPSERAETEAETAALAIISGRKACIEPRGETAGAIARTPVGVLRTQWGESICLLGIPRAARLLREGNLEQAFNELELVNTIVARIKGDSGFPSGARSNASVVQRCTDLIMARMRMRRTGGISGEFVDSLLQEILSLARPEHIYREGEMTPGRLEMNQFVWRTSVQDEIVEVIERLRSEIREGAVNPSEYVHQFRVALPLWARMRRNAPGQPREARARILHLMRRLEQAREVIQGAGEPASGPEARREQQLFHLAEEYARMVYDALRQAEERARSEPSP
jgi:hypothetical protein